MNWFTSDLHLGHQAVIGFCDRPFRSVDEMNRRLIAEINARVGREDALYVVGDFAYRVGVEEQKELRARILCRNVFLVPGNHDKDWEADERQGVFNVLPQIFQMKVGERRCVLCHYPIEDWPGSGRGSIHLHGHIHSCGPGYNDEQLEGGMLRMDVGVDANGYAPMSEDEVLARFEGRAWRARHEKR